MEIVRLQSGVKYTCSHCGGVIPNGGGVSINEKPYCETCGEKFLKGFKKLVSKIEEKYVLSEINRIVDKINNKIENMNNGIIAFKSKMREIKK